MSARRTRNLQSRRRGFAGSRLAFLATAALIAATPASLIAEGIPLRGPDLISVGVLGWIAPNFELPVQESSRPVLSAQANGKAEQALRRVLAYGEHAGFAGLVYDNRDRKHSDVPASKFPALARLRYGADLRAENLDYGLGGFLILPGIVIGNSSTAVTSGAAPRSLPRFAMTTPWWPERSYRSYANNHIYVYPEHRDHDEVDLFPANWPYMVTTQGSSGSDQPFLAALLMTVAALPADTFAYLADARLIAPTLQMILRRSQVHVRSRAQYRSALAHPTVFDKRNLSPERMIGLAAALRPETVPPMVRLHVMSETFSKRAGLGRLNEQLFTTPSSIARIWRGAEWTQTMVVSADQTAMPAGQAVTFSWVLLKGDPNRVAITPIGAVGKSARISVQWQDTELQTKGPVFGNSGPPSRRVEIGVFASNEVHDSAPAFISILFPTHQARSYVSGPDGQMRIAQIDYDSVARGAAFDPMIFWSAPWSDRARYDGSGDLEGWQRQQGTTLRYVAADKRGGAYDIDRTDPTLPILRHTPVN